MPASFALMDEVMPVFAACFFCQGNFGMTTSCSALFKRHFFQDTLNPRPFFAGIMPIGLKPATICLQASKGLQAEQMRTATRFLAILTLAALLAPSVRWASLRISLDDCACPTGACMCATHHQAHGHIPSCCQGKGGQCGMESHDSYLSSILSTLIYVPTEHLWWNPLAPWSFGRDASDISLLPPHTRIPEQPPRATL